MEGFDVRGSGERRRVTLWERLSAVEDGSRGSSTLAGLTLDAVISGSKRVQQPPMASETVPPETVSTPTSGARRTLLDIIRNDEPHNQKDKKSWKTFRDRLRLKRAGAAWTSSLHTPTSDIIQPQPRHPHGHHVRFVTPESAPENSTHPHNENAESENVTAANPPQRPVFSRRTSSRIGYSSDSGVNLSDDAPLPGSRRLATALAEERTLSAREAAAAQEAAEAESVAAAVVGSDEEEEEEEGTAGGGEPVRMSLMDLLEETDRQMGLSGSRYAMGEDDDYEEEEEEEEVVVAVEEDDRSGGGVEHTCCVCMLRHKGAAFIPCGHTFCRLCSRELLVQRGQCPICNGFILEILDIF